MIKKIKKKFVALKTLAAYSRDVDEVERVAQLCQVQSSKTFENSCINKFMLYLFSTLSSTFGNTMIKHNH